MNKRIIVNQQAAQAAQEKQAAEQARKQEAWARMVEQVKAYQRAQDEALTPDTIAHIAIYEDSDGNRREKLIAHADAQTYAEARRQAEQAAQAGEKLKAVYVDDTTNDDGISLYHSARAIVRISLKNSCKREGSGEQWARYLSACNPYSAGNHDVQDMTSEACKALMQARADGLNTYDAVLYTFRSLYRYQYAQRAVKLSVHDMRTVFLDDGEDVTRRINAYARRDGSAVYDGDNEDAERKSRMVNSIMATLTPTQEDIAACLARGMSVRAIAARRGCTARAVQKNIEFIRKKAARLYPDDAIVFDDECSETVSTYKAEQATFDARRQAAEQAAEQAQRAEQARRQAAQRDTEAAQAYAEAAQRRADARRQAAEQAAEQAEKTASGAQARRDRMERRLIAIDAQRAEARAQAWARMV